MGSGKMIGRRRRLGFGGNRRGFERDFYRGRWRRDLQEEIGRLGDDAYLSNTTRLWDFTPNPSLIRVFLQIDPCCHVIICWCPFLFSDALH